jgi:hypothetical protein
MEPPMPKYLSGLIVVLCFAGPAAAAEPTGKLIREDWDAAYLDGHKAGYVRFTVREFERDSQKILRTTMALSLTLRRFEETVQMNVETGTDETPDGKVAGVFMKQALGKNQNLVLHGTVDGDQLVVKVTGNMNMEKKVKWNDKVIGLYKEQQLFKDKAAKPGDKFSYLHFEPMISAVVGITVTVKDFEDVKVNGIDRKLLRAEAIPDKIQGVQLPGTSFWLDKELTVIRSEVAMPGLGKLVLARCTKDVALSPVIPAKIGDIGLTQLIPVNRRIADAQNSNNVIYKVTLPGDDDPGTSFVQDNRQEIKNVKGKTFELHIKAVRQPPAKAPEGAKVDDEYLKSS